MVDSEPLPLLATKLYLPPARENLVIRPRLHYKLSENPNSRLVLVTAPAGSGKTTLVTSWLAKQNRDAAWVSLDRHDNDPLIFLSYVAAALHEIEAGVCKTIRPLLASTDPPPTSILLTYLINDLTCLKEPAILVLDDYHVITSSKVIEATEFLIENKPPNLQIIITSRRMPEFSVSRWRARNEIVEISAYDLVFNYDEAWHFLLEAMALEVSDREVAALCERTEGWVTGLQLAALGLRSRPNYGDEFIHEMGGDDRLIGDYLVDEVIEQQPLEVRQFLVRSSILNRLSAPLCNTLLEIDNAQELLAYLEQSNLFLIPLDNRRIWYRYHHLFGEMLRTRLDQKRPEMVPVLYQRAIQWHLQNDLIAEAIDYAFEAEDYEQAADLIENRLDDFLVARQSIRLMQWAEAVSDTVLKEYDVLWSQYILALFVFGEFDKALAVLHRLWHEEPLPDEKAQIVRAIEYPLLTAIYLHTALDAPLARELAQKGLAILPEDNLIMRAIALGHFGSASLFLGDLESAQKYILEALDLLGDTSSLSLTAVFRNYLAGTLAAEGKLHEAAREHEANQQLILRLGSQEGSTNAGTLIGLGLLYYEWNRLEEAAEFVRQGVRLAEEGRHIEFKLQACQAAVILQLAGEEFPGIKDHLDKIETAVEVFQNPPLVMDRLMALRSMLAVGEGNQIFAEEWAERFTERDDGQVSILQQPEWLCVARIKLQAGQKSESLELLQALLLLAEEQKRQRDVIHISALLAAAWNQAGDIDRGQSVLKETLSAAEEEGYLRSFVDAGPVMREMLQMILAENGRSAGQIPSRAYIQRIIDAFPDQPEAKPRTANALLTPRESEILQLLADGLAYAQISGRLVITENTLKTHIKRIYSKLHVNNRTQAVLAAQELNIL